MQSVYLPKYIEKNIEGLHVGFESERDSDFKVFQKDTLFYFQSKYDGNDKQLHKSLQKDTEMLIINNGNIEKMFIEPGKNDTSGNQNPYGETSPENILKFLKK